MLNNYEIAASAVDSEIRVLEAVNVDVNLGDPV
jgi:hypothetical protein